MCRLVWNMEPSTSWNSQGLSRPVTGLLYVYLDFGCLSGAAPVIHTHVQSGLARLFGAWAVITMTARNRYYELYMKSNFFKFIIVQLSNLKFVKRKISGFSFKIFILTLSPLFFDTWYLLPEASTPLPSPPTSAVPLHVNSFTFEFVYCIYIDSVDIR